MSKNLHFTLRLVLNDNFTTNFALIETLDCVLDLMRKCLLWSRVSPRDPHFEDKSVGWIQFIVVMTGERTGREGARKTKSIQELRCLRLRTLDFIPEAQPTLARRIPLAYYGLRSNHVPQLLPLVPCFSDSSAIPFLLSLARRTPTSMNSIVLCPPTLSLIHPSSAD
ncbi:hypothetical protein BDR07DRAFT_1464258 [Suillus spraguei]|nr:hypothetical protein BDR07DRAFT_1464258 [Suillus spraguei]